MAVERTVGLLTKVARWFQGIPDFPIVPVVNVSKGVQRGQDYKDPSIFGDEEYQKRNEEIYRKERECAQDLKLPPRFDTQPPLVFIQPGGHLAIGSHLWVRVARETLKTNPETAEIWKAIESGPNAALYQRLSESIKAKEKEGSERRGNLGIAANSLFFGNAVTDANIEGMILTGGPHEWSEMTQTRFWTDPDEHKIPELLLVVYRAREIQNGEFNLPTNAQELHKNAQLQIDRIQKLQADGIIREKVRLMAGRVSYMNLSGRADNVCGKVIDSLRTLQKDYIPRFSRRGLFKTSHLWMG